MKAFFGSTVIFCVGLIFLVPLGAQAALPCGSIIAPSGFNTFFVQNAPIISTPVVDCADPFIVSPYVTSPYTVTIAGIVIQEGDTISIPPDGTNDIHFAGRPLLSGVNHVLFLHDGNDYRYVSQVPLPMTVADVRVLAQAFFDLGVDITPYVVAEMNGWQPDAFVDSAQQSLFDNFDDYVFYNFVGKPAKLLPGTYTLVSKEYLLMLSKNTLSKRIWQWLVPTAQAQVTKNIFTLTFTLVAETPEPDGASSVLFLPGIQASRLYKKGTVGTEDQLWEPNLFGGDVQELEMTSVGQSVNNVYTRDVMDSVTGLGDIYSGFLNFLDTEKTTAFPIKNYNAFAYDWRFATDDIALNGTLYQDGMKSVVNTLEELAASSYTGRVTVIAHSNGGLVAKSLLSELKRMGKSDLVDRVIFIGTPQLGTPKAIGTIMHGYDQQALYGLVIDASTARTVINNMPGAYGLLPSEKYFGGLIEPIITFSDTSSTLPYRLAYGNSISTFSEYVSFLEGNDTASRDVTGPLAVPVKANAPLMQTAFDLHRNTLDNWIAPSGVEVVEIVGTGLPTMKGIEYREIEEGENCMSVGGAPSVCTPQKYLKPYAQLTKYGDQTVVQKSAEAYEGEKQKFFVNLKLINTVTESEYKHANFTEVPQVQQLISNILLATSTTNTSFVSTNYTTFTDAYDVEVIDSPVRMLATDESGLQTGVVIENGNKVIIQDILGSQYFEFAGTKYLVIPKNTNHTTNLYGEENGNYALTIAELGSDDSQSIAHFFQNAIVTPTMIASYTNTEGVFSKVNMDINGDGIIDSQTSIDGVPIRYTYADLQLAIKELGLSRKKYKKIANSIKKAEKTKERKERKNKKDKENKKDKDTYGEHNDKHHTNKDKKKEKKLFKKVFRLLKKYERKQLITTNQVEYINLIIKNIQN